MSEGRLFGNSPCGQRGRPFPERRILERARLCSVGLLESRVGGGDRRYLLTRPRMVPSGENAAAAGPRPEGGQHMRRWLTRVVLSVAVPFADTRTSSGGWSDGRF